MGISLDVGKRKQPKSEVITGAVVEGGKYFLSVLVVAELKQKVFSCMSS